MQTEVKLRVPAMGRRLLVVKPLKFFIVAKLFFFRPSS